MRQKGMVVLDGIFQKTGGGIILIQDKLEVKFNRVRQQFGCGYYSVCCRNSCPCILKYQDYDTEIMRQLKKEFDQKTVELFGE